MDEQLRLLQNSAFCPFLCGMIQCVARAHLDRVQIFHHIFHRNTRSARIFCCKEMGSAFLNSCSENERKLLRIFLIFMRLKCENVE